MQVLSIIGKRACTLVERPTPRADGDFVVVKVLAAPLCTEYKAFDAGNCSDCLGHEAAGEVVEVAQPGRVRVGDRVVVMPTFPCGKCPLCVHGDFIFCRSGLDPLAATRNETGAATYAQFLLKQDWLLVPIPEDLSIEHAAMACCGLGPTFGAMQTMAVDGFDTVLITGMGPVGLGGVINGVSRGARVIAIESHPYRANLAKRLGATAVIDPQEADVLAQILALTGGVGVDKAIDCAGVPQAQRLLIDATRRRGHVTFVAEASDLTLNVSGDLLRKGLTLHGQWHYNLGDAPRLMQVIRRSRSLLEAFITHTFPLSQAQEAFETQLTGHCGKIVLRL